MEKRHTPPNLYLKDLKRWRKLSNDIHLCRFFVIEIILTWVSIYWQCWIWSWDIVAGLGLAFQILWGKCSASSPWRSTRCQRYWKMHCERELQEVRSQASCLDIITVPSCIRQIRLPRFGFKYVVYSVHSSFFWLLVPLLCNFLSSCQISSWWGRANGD